MILDEYTNVRIGSKNYQYYKNKGYDVKNGKTIAVNIVDLPLTTKQKIRVLCEYCGEEKTVCYSDYIISKKNGGKYACKQCATLKQKETLLNKYGVSRVSDIPGVQEKRKQTNIKKYGVPMPSQSPEIQSKIRETNIKTYGGPSCTCSSQIVEKIKQTNMNKYGVECVFQSQAIKEKIHQTLQDKYGVDNPSQFKEFKEKREQTNIERYGVPNPAVLGEFVEKAQNTMLERYGYKNAGQVPEFKEKQIRAMCDNNKMVCSVQQLYLFNLFNGILNYPFQYYALDIYLPECNLDIEYNGGGHDLQVKLGAITKEDLERKEIIRSTYLYQADINQLTIISRKDYLPSDNILLKMLEETLSYLSTTNHHWVEFDIDNSTMRNATGTYPYDYGTLRKIKKTDIQDNNKEIIEETQ